MTNPSELSSIGLLAGGFLFGSLGKVLSSYFRERLKRLMGKQVSGPVVIKRKATGELATIPDHYDSDAVDALIRQLRKADKVPA